MANLREVKQRIGSVVKTKKITSAMKMVAAAKFKRAQQRMSKARTYQSAMTHIITDLTNRLTATQLPGLLTQNNAKKEAIIVISGDRGLCGGFNTNVFKKAREVLANKSTEAVDLYLIGNKGIQQFKNSGFTIKDTFSGLFSDELTESTVSKLIAPIIDSYINGDYSKITLVYNEFVSALTSNQVDKQLLPIKLTDWKPNKVTASDFIYEPSKAVVLEQLLKRTLSLNVFLALLESNAAEEGARMAAMDSATDNASEMIRDLTLQYNRSRQAAITTELTEIVAGAASLN